MTNKCPYCEGKEFIVGHGAFGEREETPCYRCVYVKETLREVIKILHNEPLGYKTESEHEKLEDYSNRLEKRIKEII